MSKPKDKKTPPLSVGAALGKVLAALLLSAALVQSETARAGQHGGGGPHGGGFHGGGFHGHGFHGYGFHGHGFHGGEFHGGFAGRHHGGFRGFHAQRFHGGEFHHHHFGFRRGIVIGPAFGGLWAGAGLGWPYSYPYEGYYGQGPYAQYWYCEDPPGYYPSVVQCNTGWQLVPAD